MSGADANNLGEAMSGTRLDWVRVWALFHEALELPAAKRISWAATQLAEAPAELRELVALLDAHERPGSVLDLPAVVLLQRGDFPEAVGDWRLKRRLGDGGMGEVFLASRSDGDYQQLAAIKLLDAAPGDDVVFAAERRALAKLRHPHIAQLYDSGSTSGGQRYLVMEYVEGERLDRWIELRQPTLEQRLGLFVQVCRAVHHAHRNLIVHRDLKPSNVLVTEDGVPKLIDFGIAAPPGGEGARLTLAYASPEQLRGDAISTASDVFALGVMLYQLIVSEHAFSAEAMSVTERIACIEAGPMSLSRSAKVPPIRGRSGRFRLSELDAILATTLDARPEQRYASAEALALDIERWLRRQPLAVRGRSPLYRLHCAITRHPWTFSLAAVSLLALVGAVLLLARQGQQLKRALAETQAHAARAEQAAGFLAGLFTDADPELRTGDAASAADLLRQGAARLADIEDSTLRAQLELVMAQALLHGGDLATAESHFRALQGHPETHVAALEGLAALAQQRGDHAEAERLQREALVDLENTDSEPPQASDARLWRARMRLAAILQSLGRLEQAAAQLLGLSEQRVSLDLAAEANIRLGALAWARGDLGRAEQHYRAALTHNLEAHDSPHHQIARAHYAIATALHRQGRYDEARTEYRQALDQRLAIYGGGHPRVAETLVAMAALAYDAGDAGIAIDLGTEALALKRALYGDDSPTLGASHTNLALALHEEGRFDVAGEHYREALRLNQRASDGGGPDVVGSLGNLALLAMDRGDLDDARRWLARARPLADALPETHRIRAFINHLIGCERLLSGDLASARLALEVALDARRSGGDGQHPHVADSLYWLAWLSASRQRFEVAIERSTAALDIRRSGLREHDWRIAQSRAQLAALQLLAGGQRSGAALDDAIRNLAEIRGDDWRLRAFERQIKGYGLVPPATTTR